MALSTQSFVQTVNNAVTAVQSYAANLIDTTVGSVQRAILEANAAIVMWLQGLILQVASITRAATSSGNDLDTWFADYGFIRLNATPATGVVTFSRFTATAQTVVPIGAQVKTGDFSQIYTVTVDITNPAYSSTLGGYILAVGVSAVSVPVVSVNASAAANAVAGAVNTLGQAIGGIDAATNVSSFSGGTNAESDTAARTRFVAYIASLSKATKTAIGFALTNLKPGMTYSFTENLTYGGVAQNGYFYVVVDDGTGSPSGTFLSSASNAIDLVRAVSTTFGVFAPVLLTANVTMTITTSAGYNHSTTATQVQAAIIAYINAPSIGGLVAWSRLAQIAYDTSAGVTNVSAVLLNSATADIQATSQQAIRVGTIVIT